MYYTRKTLTLVLLFNLQFTLWSNVIGDSLLLQNQITNGVSNAEFIFEGKVIKKTSYYNENQDFIYTSNTVKVNAVWKTNEEIVFAEDQLVEVITRGGIVGKTELKISHEKRFYVGEKGMFLCKYAVNTINPNSNISGQYQYDLFDGLYFEYDYSKPYVSASYASINFKCIEELYEVIDVNYIAQCIDVYPNGTLQGIKHANLKSIGNQKLLIGSQGTGHLELTFENAKTVSEPAGNFFEFDVYATAQNSVYFDYHSIQ
jgi:hypothetical protein